MDSTDFGTLVALGSARSRSCCRANSGTCTINAVHFVSAVAKLFGVLVQSPASIPLNLMNQDCLFIFSLLQLRVRVRNKFFVNLPGTKDTRIVTVGHGVIYALDCERT
jgi:hypothetical protein